MTVRIAGADLLDPNSAASRTQKFLNSLRSWNGTDPVLAWADELIRCGWHGLGLAAYNAGIRRDPAAAHLRLHRGMELFRRRWWAAAAEDFRLAASGEFACEFRGQARTRLAWAYRELGKHADAASTLAGELEASADARQDIEQAGLRLLLAEFFDLGGKPDLAGKERETAAKLHPRTAEAANKLAWEWIMVKAGASLGDNARNVPAAVLLARRAVALEPGEAMFGNTYGFALYRDGRVAEAEIGPGSQSRAGQGHDGRLGPVPPGHVPAPSRRPQGRPGQLRQGCRLDQRARRQPRGRAPRPRRAQGRGRATHRLDGLNHRRSVRARQGRITGPSISLFVNGSVHFVKSSISGMTWRALGTIARGEVISADQY